MHVTVWECAHYILFSECPTFEIWSLVSVYATSHVYIGNDVELRTWLHKAILQVAEQEKPFHFRHFYRSRWIKGKQGENSVHDWCK
jgi:hypothetical protein